MSTPTAPAVTCWAPGGHLENATDPGWCVSCGAAIPPPPPWEWWTARQALIVQAAETARRRRQTRLTADRIARLGAAIERAADVLGAVSEAAARVREDLR
jgi:hypothetical protein